MSHKFINLFFIMASGAKLSAMVPQCLGHGAMPCRPWCRIVLAMVPCLVAMVPQFCDLSAMFTGHGARVFFWPGVMFYRPWCHSVLPKCHTLSAMVPQCFFFGHRARPWCRIVWAMVPCVAAMVPQCSSLSSMFAGHGATVFLARCHVFIGHGATIFC